MSTSSRKARLDALRRRTLAPAPKPEEELWDDIYQSIRSGNLLPILGGAIRLKQIFGLEHTEEPLEAAQAVEQIASQALDAALAIQDGYSRVQALTALAPQLSGEQQRRTQEEALQAALAIQDGYSRVQALTALAPQLSGEQQRRTQEEALQAALAIQDGYSRAQALTALAPQLSGEQQRRTQEEALAGALAIQDEYGRVQALTALAPQLSGEQQRRTLKEVVNAALDIKDEASRAEALTALAPQLSGEQQRRTQEQALASAVAIQDEVRRVRALTALAPQFSGEQQRRTQEQALAGALAIQDGYSRVRALTALAPQLSGEQQRRTQEQALAGALAIQDEVGRAQALTALAPQLSGEQLQQALTATLAIRDEVSRVRALLVLAPHLSDEQLQQALAAARAQAPQGEPESQILMDLSELWAAEIGYPLQESRNLARVAQYNKVIAQDPLQEKIRFLTFLKESILDLAEKYDPSVQEGVPRLRQEYRSSNLSFADIVTELDYPRYSYRPDPLRILARFRLPVYVTTSGFDIIERALKAEGAANVRTQFCLWNMEESQVAPELRPDPDYIPSREEPLVYHLFGLERYPQSLVLSEDDYLNFLRALAANAGTEKDLLPLQLRRRFEESSLLLLGFRLADWEFRVVFRGLFNLLRGSLRELNQGFSIAVQLNPRDQEPVADEAAAQQYIQQYFARSRFQVLWMSSDEFIRSLWDYWDRRRRGEI